MSPEKRTFYLGTSGWAYRDWVRALYPHDMPPAEYLAAYAQHFDTVEIEHTFFETPARALVQSWRRRTPDGFIFCPRLPRRITHTQGLEDSREQLEAFLAVMGELGDKLGPILMQLPDGFRSGEQAQLEAFLSTLPHELPFAVEFRHSSWLKDTTFRLLEQYQVAWVAEIIIGKQRNGPTGVVRLAFCGAYTRFDNLKERRSCPMNSMP